MLRGVWQIACCIQDTGLITASLVQRCRRFQVIRLKMVKNSTLSQGQLLKRIRKRPFILAYINNIYS